MNGHEGDLDLLTLIGETIELLQQGIELFETGGSEAGLTRLAAVIDEIDSYLQRAGEDPLLRLAGLPQEKVDHTLSDVKADISSVIAGMQSTSG